MVIFEFTDYRSFLRSYIKRLPRNGRGEINKIAVQIGIHPSLLSQILSEEKNLNSEQAHLISEYLGLTSLETDYFLVLVQLQRAGTNKLKVYYREKLKQLKESSLNLSKNIRQDKELSDEEKSILYSHWLYLAVWLFTSIGNGKTLEDITAHFEITRERALEILNFLVSTRLCIVDRNTFRMGSQSIHVGKGSPHLYRHHTNWRIKAIDNSDKINDEELMYTAPISISKNDFTKIRLRLNEVIKEVTNAAIESKAEDIAYFGIDFFRIKK